MYCYIDLVLYGRREGHCNNKTHRYGILKCMNKQGFCLFCVLILITRKHNSGYELIAAKGSNDNIVCNIIHMNINDELRLMSIYQSFKSDRTLGVDKRSNQRTKNGQVKHSQSEYVDWLQLFYFTFSVITCNN